MRKFAPIFIIAFFLSLNFGALLYINSSFLAQFYSTEVVGFIFLKGAAINAILFFLAPRLVNLLSKEFLLFLVLLLSFLSTLIEALATTPIILAAGAILYASVLYLSYYCLDIFLEADTPDRKTGKIRGIYSSTFNAGLLLGAFLVTFLIPHNDYKLIYLASAAFLVLPLLLSLDYLIRRESHKHREHWKISLSEWWQRRNIRAVSMCKFALETFYGVMVIYTPLYLHGTLGFEWSELGIIFSIMLLPFVLFQWPAGELADRVWGEKEMMSIGFFITGIALLVMPFLPKDFYAWLFILFLSRVGAAITEIMTESYFFKQISSSDTGFIAIFRLLRPIGILFGTVLAFATLEFSTLSGVFIALSLIIFFALYESLHLKDTR